MRSPRCCPPSSVRLVQPGSGTTLIPLLPAPTPLVPPPIAITPEIEALLARHAPVAVGVSGGKDSDATALRLAAFLDEIGHRGPRVLVHADLGLNPTITQPAAK